MGKTGAGAGRAICDLASRNGGARRAAREQVLRMGATIVPTLIRAARGRDANLRWEAVDALGTIRDLRGTKVVLDRVLRDDDVHVRWRSIWAITALNDGLVVRALLRELKKPDPTKSLNAAVALSVFDRAEAAPRLLKELRSSDEFRRWEAANSLGSLSALSDALRTRVISALTVLLMKDTPEIRRETAMSLGRLGGHGAVHPLLLALQKDEDPQVRWRAAFALKRIGEKRVIRTLKRRLTRETDTMVREEIATAIDELGATTGYRVQTFNVR